MSEVTSKILDVTNNSNTTPIHANTQKSLRFPKSILSVSREEFYGQDEAHHPLKLTIKKGLTHEICDLPQELLGSVFIIASAGNAASKLVSPNDSHTVLPSENGWTSILNGDGMVYRLDFLPNPEIPSYNSAYLSNRLLKTPSFFADRITSDSHERTDYGHFEFINFGLARISPYLGMSEQVSTAFLPMPFQDSKNSRLLVTWDVGRPYEIDPDSLAIIAPVGLMKNWNPVVKNVFSIYPVPFPQNMSSAHPCFDPNTGEMFTINIVKSLNTLIQVHKLFPDGVKSWASSLHKHHIFRRILKIFIEFWIGLLEFLGLGRKDTTYLVRWDGSQSLKKYKITYKGRPIKITSTMHQMGLSKDYIILTETAFKLVLEDFLPYLQQQLLKLKQCQKTSNTLSDNTIWEKILTWLRFHRQYLTFPQSPDTKFYIVPRTKLKRLEDGGAIEAERFIIQGECNHYLVDYDNPNHKITIHAALNKAADAAEFIHQNDVSPFGALKTQQLAGMFSNTMAVNRPAMYVVDGRSGRKEKEEVLKFDQAKEFTWSIGLYAYRDDLPTARFEDIYWLGFGAWQDIQTEFIYDMYKDYIYRDPQMPLDKMMEVIKQGIPTILSRLHIDRQANPSLSVADAYNIPGEYFLNSPQFVPHPNSTGSTDGYIICTAIYSDNLISEPEEGSGKDAPWSNNSELWIFDANNLQQGPLYRLSHPKLNLSFTVHTTWMKDHAPSPTREYDVRKDFQDLVKKAAKSNPLYFPEDRKKIVELFDRVYEAFNRDRKST